LDLHQPGLAVSPHPFSAQMVNSAPVARAFASSLHTERPFRFCAVASRIPGLPEGSSLFEVGGLSPVQSTDG